MKPKGAESPDLEGPITRVLALGYGPSAVCRLLKIDIERVWRFEWWNWSTDETVTLYTKHQAAIDELARAAGLGRPCVLDEIDRDRERQEASAAWLRRERESR